MTSRPEKYLFDGIPTSWYYRELASNSDMEENKLLNKVIIFVLFAHKIILVAS